MKATKQRCFKLVVQFSPEEYAQIGPLMQDIIAAGEDTFTYRLSSDVSDTIVILTIFVDGYLMKSALDDFEKILGVKFEKVAE
jgi:hypothetical protein